VARNLHVGDYTNLSVELDLDLSGGITGVPTELPTLLPSEIDPTVVLDLVTRCLRSGDLASKPCQRLLSSVQGLLELQEACLKSRNRDTAVCRALAQVPGLPQPPSGPGGLPSALPTVLPELPGGLGLGRVGAGPTRRGPTMGQLSRAFDPALVQLLVPGMVTR
jgi:phospholipid/cholesterol/gamma-HCH transport system substrate-binding protein